MRLIDVPGVGAKLNERLAAHYGDEDSALEALLRGDVAGLQGMRGMSQRQAVALVQRARGAVYSVKPTDFLVTEEAVRIYDSLMELLTSQAHTDRAREKLATYFPSSSRNMVDENRRFAESAITSASLLAGCDLSVHLSRIKPLRKEAAARVRNRAVAVDSPSAIRALKERGVDRAIDVHLVESLRELRDLAQGYDRVTLLGGSIDSFALPEIEEAESDEDWYLVPERVLRRYQENGPILEAMVEAAEVLAESKVASFEGLDDLSERLARLKVDEDPELLRLDRIIAEAEGRVAEAVGWGNAELKKRMERFSLTLAGDDLLSALGRGGDLRDVFKSRMGETFNEVLKEARDMASTDLEMKGAERASLEEIIPQEVRYPLEEDREALIRFVQEVRKRAEAKRLNSLRDLARELAGRWSFVEALHEELLEFDVGYSLGTFALERGLLMPTFAEEGCVGFIEGRNLFLQDPEPVSYSVGPTGLVEAEERTAILSGVNSGGKTTLLELVAQVVILAHMGFPVPAAACRITIFDSLYYFGKSRGTLGAGAFEATMRKFSVLAGGGRKIVLADELEAITEPGASAKIIASLLDELSRGGSVAIFVSHLAEDVARFSEEDLRIDGIDALGLDEDGELIVDRTPVYYRLAKSTPELIIERLARTSEGEEREFYSRLLSKFR
ncbi:DNA mismatch repair protein MutS [Methanotrichaceae archaeon M04Ac]|uniref:DNA-binding protein MutS2 n=1 Tax=Candidatus Methanocrinis alkalitolerans TaxID=3033395 RepID=A0ABT5XDV5_9EURY|nr:DNA mismatch repair protein MutS [Candidatus Methanocrinis alkalitolerans]MDF0592894.1 DNA mismatch repair protein MutS [Candidatus Methanocrinis alkalitolerans]